MNKSKSEVLKYSLLNAFGTAFYIALIISVISVLEDFVGEPQTILAPIVMLMLFVFSAAFTGFLVFGRPIMWYIDGKKREAVLLLAYTLGIFFALLILLFLFLILLPLAF